MSEHRCGHNSDIDENDNLWVDGTDLRKQVRFYCHGTVHSSRGPTRAEIVYEISKSVGFCP